MLHIIFLQMKTFRSYHHVLKGKANYKFPIIENWLNDAATQPHEGWLERKAFYNIHGPHLLMNVVCVLISLSHSLLKVLFGFHSQCPSDFCMVKGKGHFSVLILKTFNIVIIFHWLIHWHFLFGVGDASVNVQKHVRIYCTVVSAIVYHFMFV